MPNRRVFLTALLAAGSLPAISWADAGSPAYLGAARTADGSFAMFGVGAEGGTRFAIPLPARGHAGAAHPSAPEALVFARRPGTFGLIIDCVAGREVARLSAPEGLHFYGHAAFLLGGSLLATTENHIATGEGRIGFWQRDAAGGYARLGDVPSGGIGPHELRAMPDGQGLVVANGGIRTHPDHGRDKLNLPTMKPNITYLDASGIISETHGLPDDLHLNSIRHLDVRGDGLVAFAMQWQGDEGTPPLLATHRAGQEITFAQADALDWARMRGYAGSLAFSADGTQVAITSPRGGLMLAFDSQSGAKAWEWQRGDICGLAAAQGGFLVSDGMGAMHHVAPGNARLLAHDMGRAWDNHLVAVPSA